MHLIYGKMLAIVVYENMKLGDNTPPEKWEAFTCKHKISDKKLANVAVILLPYKISIILKPKRHIKRRFTLGI